jgi:protein-tyrosine phosphatase
MWAAARTSAGLSVLFLVVYGGSNWITAHRSDVGTWYYGWERYIPFVPLMIVPYMSIDFFFLAGPFFCRDPRELRTLARRIGFAILAAGACFLLFPLRFAFERPEAGGLLGAIFDWFRGMDQPYNQLPSLHITLRTILAHLYVRHTAGLPRVGVRVWFSLIGFSTLLTYQHHFVDIVGGFVLAGVCFYLFREESPRLPVTRNLRIGLYYGMGAAALIGVTALTWPRGGLLLWPALALAIVMAAYCGVGPAIYRKTEGRLPFSTWFVLAPTLLGQHLSLVYYRRHCRPWDEITPRLWIGRKLNDAEAAEAVRRGVTAVLDLTVEFSEAAPFLAVNYRHLPILDLTAPSVEQLLSAVKFIEERAADGIVYVHCKVGYSRTAAVVGAYLLASRQAASADEAVTLLRKARPSIIVRPEAWAALRAFERVRSAEAAG